MQFKNIILVLFLAVPATAAGWVVYRILTFDPNAAASDPNFFCTTSLANRLQVIAEEAEATGEIEWLAFDHFTEDLERCGRTFEAIGWGKKAVSGLEKATCYQAPGLMLFDLQIGNMPHLTDFDAKVTKLRARLAVCDRELADFEATELDLIAWVERGTDQLVSSYSNRRRVGTA